MAQENLGFEVRAGGIEAATAAEVNERIAETYGLMALGILTAALAYSLVLFSPALQSALTVWVILGLAVVQFGISMVLSIAGLLRKLRPPVLKGLFFAYTTLFGVTLGSVIGLITTASIIQAFLIASSVFVVAAAYGYLTQRSLVGLQGFLLVGLGVLLVSSLANFFLGSSLLQLVLNGASVLLFTLFAAFDSQRIRDQMLTATAEEVEYIQAIGAFSLFLDFINLFWAILDLVKETASSVDV